MKKDFIVLGIPCRYMGAIAFVPAAIMLPFVVTGILTTLIPLGVILLMGWLVGIVLTRRDPYFFTKFLYGRFPRLAEKIFQDNSES